jgi:hypothetical protein
MAYRLSRPRSSRQGLLGAKLHGGHSLVKSPESELQDLCYQAASLEGFMHRKPHSHSEKVIPGVEEASPLGVAMSLVARSKFRYP